jgi:hypothetical protein
MGDKLGMGMTGLQDPANTLEEAADFGRWWCQQTRRHIEISPMAARCLDIQAGPWWASN